MDEKKNHPRSQYNSTSLPDPLKIRKQAEKKAKAVPFPDIDTMTREELRHMFQEMKVKQIEAELQNEQLRSQLEKKDDQAALLSIVTENMLDMVALTDMEGNFTFAGKSHEILGYEPGFLIGKNVMNFVHPEDLPSILEKYAEFVSSGHPRRVEYRCRCEDGSYLWLETLGNFITDENGSPQKIVFSSRNITDRKRVEEALRQSELRLRQIIDLVPHFIFAKDVHGTFLLANKAVADAYGNSPENLIGKSDYDFTQNTEDFDFFIECDKKVIESGTGLYNIEESITDAKGSRRYLETTKIPFTTASTTTPAILGISVDITEHKETLAALRHERERFKQILNSFPFGIYIVDQNHRIEYTNQLLKERIGHPEGRPCYEYLHNLKEPCPWCLNERVFQGETVRWEWHSTQTGKDYELVDIPLYNEDGTVSKLEILNDVTERKFAENELKKRNQFIETILDNLPIGLAVNFIDEGKATYMNKKFQEIYGWPKEDLEDIENFFQKVYPNAEYREQIKKMIFEDIEAGDPEKMVWEGIEATGQDGRKKIIMAKNIPLDDQNFMISTVQDITESSKLQIQLNQAQKMESIGRLAGGVAHDFNNKLSIINGYAELAVETIDPSNPLHETIQEIHTAGKKSADIVRQLLAFARQQTISPVLLDLNETISGMLKMLQRLIGENIDLQWYPGKNLWPIKIDPSQVDQIMANLAVNSRDSISDVGKLNIQTKNTIVDEDYCRSNPEAIPGQYVMLEVSDDGCGIEKEVQDLLFEPFFTTKEIGKGTGLGLPTVYGIVKQNNGFINVYSEPGEGTTFKIYFPSEDAKNSFLYPAKESIGKIPTGTETVLVVEDDNTILQMSKQMLERLGYTVETAGTPSEALKISNEYEGIIHLLITDVIMPELNGRDLSVRLSKNHPDLKTLYMSGYTADVIAHHGVIDEGVKFIQKPFSLKDLAVKVREVIEQG